jgi:non-specific serine/threonine protein kinase
MDAQGDTTAATLRFGDFEIDRASRTLRRHGRPVPLGARAIDLLWALVAARGELVTKDELLQRAWPGLVVEEANVQVQVSALRKALGADAIATVPSLGYRLALPVTDGAGTPARHNLVAERTPFVGREAVLAEARSQLGKGVLLTLIGIGGSGKTRLARRLAELELGRFGDGVWWIDLAPLDRAEQLVPVVAQTLGCPLNGKETPLQALTRALRPKGLLLVLDNCEHLVDGVCTMLDALLDAAPGLRVLATSREALGLRGEMIVPVKPLATPPADATAEQVWSSESARLFLQSAELACPQLHFDDEAAPTVAAICRQLDGIPLALELAATQLQVVGPEQLRALLQQRLRLALGTRRQVPRQQTLHAVIRWSVDNLAEHEREILASLAVCAGGCDMEAVRAIAGAAAGDEQLVWSLARLADRALITVRHIAGAARYHLLETVREYVLEALVRGHDEAALQDRHRDHYLQLAEAVRPQLLQASTRARALARLDLERENMGRAIDWAVMTRHWVLGARLVHSLMRYWAARAWQAPALELAEAVLAVAEPDQDPAHASELMADAASLAASIGRVAHARSLAMAAARLAQRARLLDAEINALVTCTLCELLDGDPARTVPDLEGLLERTAEAGLTAQQCRLLSLLGQARTEMGDFAAAREALERARRLSQEQGNLMGVALDTINLALAAVLASDAAEARRLLRELARQQPPVDHYLLACYTLFTVGCLARLEGQWARCLRAHLAAFRHFGAGSLADNRLRRREREHDIDRARQALDPATQAAVEREAASGTLASDLAWALEGLRA